MKATAALLGGLLACVAGAALAQGLLLVAKPAMADPNFSESVVLVTQDGSGAAIGVIINRPTSQSLAGLLPGNEKLKPSPTPSTSADRSRTVGSLRCIRLMAAARVQKNSVSRLPC